MNAVDPKILPLVYYHGDGEREEIGEAIVVGDNVTAVVGQVLSDEARHILTPPGMSFSIGDPSPSISDS